MLDIKYIRENAELVKKGIADKQVSADIDALLKIDEEWRAKTVEVETFRKEKNEAAKARDIERGKAVGESLKATEKEISELEAKRDELIYAVPNICFPDVPVGADEDANVVLETIGEPRKFDFPIRDHVELGEMTDTIDIETARKTSGSRFYYLKGDGALLELAIQRFVLDKLIAKGFTPILPPMMIRAQTLFNAGKWGGTLEDTEAMSDFFRLEDDDLLMIGTAEHTLASLHTDEVIDEDKLPIRYCGWSSCFRREAGAAGKDTKGILRVHQFDKLEMFIFSRPDQSDEEHKLLISTQKEVWTELGIPFRVVANCTGDIGWSDARLQDCEAWMPTQDKYREVTSGSNCTDFQSRRSNTKFKNAEGKKELVHTLNATGVAIPRAIIAIYENYQNEDGTITIPEVLRQYMGGRERIELKK